MNRKYWYEKWQLDKDFVIQNDRLKKKSYVYTSMPKVNMYGFQTGAIYGIIASDLLARYLRMQDYNVLFPTGLHSLCNSSYIESKRNSLLLNDDISKIYNKQMYELGIGINEDKHINLRHNEFVSNLQQAFIDLYNYGFIEYKNYKCYYDKENNKIYDYINRRDINDKKTYKSFVLKIDSIIDEVILKIDELECDNSIKESLKNCLMPTRLLRLSLSLSNGSTLNISMSEPEYLGGVSYIILNPEYIDITEYVDINEYNSVINYLEGNLGFDIAFSGISAQNPLTGLEIPVFISDKYNKDIYLGIPGVDEEDREFALINELEIIEIIKNNKLINSDFLNGINIDIAKDKIIDAFLDADIALLDIKYIHNEILLSSLDNFGPLYPFLEEKDKNILNPLSGYLPYTFSDKFRPVLPVEVDLLGDPLNGTINNLFIDGMLPIISMLYDNIGSITSIASKDAIKEYKNWNGIDYMLVDDSNLESEVLMPIIINCIIKKIAKCDIPNIIKRVDTYSHVRDVNNLEILRSNNNLIDFDRLLNRYKSDTIRYYFLLCGKDNIIFDYNRLDEIEKKLDICYNVLRNLGQSPQTVELQLYNTIKKCNIALEKYNYSDYVKIIDEFIDKYIMTSFLNKNDAYKFIRLIYPICPFMAEDLYLEIFKSKYSIINEEWPKI